VPLKVTRSPKG